MSESLTICVPYVVISHLNQPWSRSVAVTVNTVVPGPRLSNTWVSNSARWNTGASSLTSITWTHNTWEVDSWGIPWSSAIIVRLKTSCSSRSKALRMEREPRKGENTENKNFPWVLNSIYACFEFFWSRSACAQVGVLMCSDSFCEHVIWSTWEKQYLQPSRTSKNKNPLQLCLMRVSTVSKI